MFVRRVSILSLLLATIVASAATAQTLPTGFAEDIVALGLQEPVDFTFLPDGRILIAEKHGIVRVHKNGALLPTPLIDLSSRVNDYWDRGLLGIAADPDFATNGHVYLFYVYENNAADYSGPKSSRLSRITVSGDTAQLGTELVVLGTVNGPSCGGAPAGADCIPADSPSHNGGSIKFAADKTIFLTIGDGAHFNIVDDLALRAQDIDSLSGKLLHITRLGQGIAGNPFWNGNAAAPRSKVWAYGLRNPFRGTLRPGTTTPYVGDVGWGNAEEINVAVAGANLGWPCYEGPIRQVGYEPLPTCQALYAQGAAAVRAPLHSYNHDGEQAAVVGGTFYTGTAYPTAFQQAYFFGDYARGNLKYLRVDANNALNGPVTDFASDVPGPVKIEPGPNGDLYYVAVISGELRRIRYLIGQPATARDISSVPWTSADNGWGPVERDMSNGDQAARDGGPLTINGSVYPKGLGVHAVSDVRFRLDGQCSLFDSDIGVDDEVGAFGSVVFQVWADGAKLYDSGVVTGAMPAIPIAVNVAGRLELALIVTDAGDGTSSDHADWADAKITCGGSGALQFAPAVSLPSGVSTHSVNAIDLNADLKLDLVAANAGANNISVWLGNGNGTFGSRVNLATGLAPKSVAVADLNRDGRPDLVTANQDSSTISVLLASGAPGSFAAKVDYASCTSSHESAIADFNRDGFVDVIVACWGGSVASLFLGRGDGTLMPRTNIATGSAPHSIIALDYDNDGLLDAAVANHGSGDVSVLRGRGNGTFDPQVRYATGAGPHSIRSGDLNADGRLDLVTANDGSHNVAVLLGQAGGTFAAAVGYPVGQVPKGVTVADLDGDGLLDIVSANTAGNYPTCCNPGGDTITVLKGNGDGTFVPSATYTVGTTPFAVTTGDLDADGDNDVMTANWHSNDVTILLNVGGADPPPVISDVTATNVKRTSATISWTTNEPADGQVEYGATAQYGSVSPLRSMPVTAHQEVLTDLTPGAQYHYRVRSRDAGGGLTLSGDRTFTTLATGSGSTIFVSDLTWTAMTNGWGPAERDRSNGEQGAADGAVIRLKTVAYTKGLGVHAASDIRYALPAGCTQFVADVGVDDEVTQGGSIIFQIWGDAVKLAESVILTRQSPTIQLSADLTGRSELRLVVTGAGDGVTGDHGDWAGARLLCEQQGNTPPVATITAPPQGLLFKVNDVINYAGSATDTQDGTLTGTSLSWSVILQHCPDATCHAHPFQNGTGSGGSFVVPDHGEGTFFEIVLTATDSGGLTGTDTRIVNPQNTVITLATSPPGLQVTVGGVQKTAPTNITTVVGSTLTISAPSPQGGNTFVSWSDGGAQQHNIVAGAANATYTATFTSPGGTTVYVSDLTWTAMTNGWGPAERDRSNGEAGATDGLPLRLAGVTYPKGLGVHAVSDVSYAIPAGCSQFLSDVGVDDEVGTLGSVIFQVFTDGVNVAQSGTLTGASATGQLSASLTGKSVLRLVVTDGGNGNPYDHADWANARMTCGSSSAGITVTPTTGLTTTEAGGTATFTVVLTTAPTANVSIALSSNDTTEGTVAPASLTFTTANWNVAQTVTVTGVNDTIVDGPIAYTIVTAAATSTDTAYNGVNPSDVSVTNTDNDTAGITVTPTTGLTTTEAGGTATFTVVLTTAPTANVSIALSSNDTTEGTVAPASLTFTTANWNVAQTVTVTGVNDTIVDGPIAYTIVTAAATSTDTAYNGVNPSDVSVTNTDNDTAGITVAPTTGLTTTEAGGTATFTVVLTTAPTASVTIGLSSSDTTEGTVAPASLTFTTANWNVAQTVTVTGVNDTIVDGPIAYTIVTAAATSTDTAYNGVNPSDVSVTNTDNDAPGGTTVYVSDLTWTSMTNGWGPAERDRSNGEAGATDGLPLRLAGVTYPKGLGVHAVSDVSYAIPAGCSQFLSDVGVDDEVGTLGSVIFQVFTDGVNVAQSGTLTGASATGQLSASLTGKSVLRLVVTDGGNGNPYDHADWANARMTCGSSSAGITVTPTTGLTTTEAGGTATFTVVLTTAPTASVTIGLSSSDTTEGTVAPASLTFTTANWNVAQTVTVTGVNDTIVDGAIAYTIVTAAATSTDTAYNGVNPSDVSVTNTDNDTAGITVTPTTGLTTTEAGGTATFTVVLTTAPAANVSIALSSNDTTEGTVAPASLTFTTANWNVAQTVTVTGVNDTIVDGPIAYTIVTAAATSTDTAYNGVNPSDVSVTNTDNDTAGITVTPTTGLTTTEAGGTATFTVVLNTQPTANVSIALSSNDTTEGTVAPASLTFTTANWNVAQTVTVTGVNDTIVDGPIAYTIVTAAATSTDTAYNGVNPSDVSVTNTDNDTAGITVTPTTGLTTTEAGGTATFTVVLTTAPTASVTIGLSSSDTTEGTVAPASLTFTTANWNVARTVTVTGVNDTIVDGPIAYTIVTAAATSTDTAYNGVNPSDVSVTNTDNDTAGITVTPTTGLTTTEAGGTATFTVVLNTQPTANVSIALSSNDTTEGTVAPASLTFTTANWNVAQTVTVTGVDDALVDGPIAYMIVTAAAASTDTAYNGMNPSNVSVTNTDNDGGTTTRYVSDLTWTAMTNGWGPAERDRSNGEQGATDGLPLRLAGVTYPKGLGVHSVSDVSYAIPAGCTQFLSDVGVDDEVGTLGSVIFQVFTDGVNVAQSATLTGASATGQLTASLTGKSVLRLVVTDGGNGNPYDHADWANARMTCTAP